LSCCKIARDGFRRGLKKAFVTPGASPPSTNVRGWKLYVEPELQRLFPDRDGNRRGRFTAAQWKHKTIRQLHAANPTRNADAWLNALKPGAPRYRIKVQFHRSRALRSLSSPIGSRRDLGLFQVNFYGFLQEFILHELGKGKG